MRVLMTKTIRHKLIAACDFDKSSVDNFCERWNISASYDDPIKMLVAENVEVLSICTPVESHHVLVMQGVKTLSYS